MNTFSLKINNDESDRTKLRLQVQDMQQRQAAEDAEQATYLAQWHRDHPTARKLTWRDVRDFMGALVVIVGCIGLMALLVYLTW